MKKTRLKMRGTSDVSVLKEEIQVLVRKIVIKRDKDCILRNYRYCDGTVLQADHLITRANSATYADTRLIVCLCLDCHGWKHWYKEAYDELVKTIISPDRVELWKKCEKDRNMGTQRKGAWDWKMHIVALEQELSTYKD